jgi:hypothetical protein
MDAARPTEKPNKLMDVPSLFFRKLRKAILKNVLIMTILIFVRNMVNNSTCHGSSILIDVATKGKVTVVSQMANCLCKRADKVMSGK